jgi:hypothetical protein
MPTCLIDQTEHETLLALHKHLRGLKVKQSDYYTKYNPRVDHFSGEPVPFKTVDQYLSTEFVSKENLRRWIAANPTKGREWAIRWLLKRKENKDLTYPPTQVELESMLCPSMHYYDRVGGYNSICKELGYTIRFCGELQETQISTNDIVIDSREQCPLFVDGFGIRAKLNVGDYGLIPSKDVGVYIERKSISDLFSTLSFGYDRFIREIQRAEEVDAYIVILIDVPLKYAMSFVDKHGNVNAAHVFKRMRDILRAFYNVQALFVKNRNEAASMVIKLLGAKNTVRNVDLQFHYERNQYV